MVTGVNKFQSSENLFKHVVAGANERRLHSQATFGVTRNDFFRRYSKDLKQSYRSLQYDVNNLGTRFLSHLLLELLVDSILIPCKTFIVLRDIILIL